MTSVNLIVAADEPAIFFASVEGAEQWMEPVDVQDAVYRAAFGPLGEVYKIETDGKTVTIRQTMDEPRPDALKAVLIRYFSAIGEAPKDDVSLSALLDRCSPSYQ